MKGRVSSQPLVRRGIEVPSPMKLIEFNSRVVGHHTSES